MKALEKESARRYQSAGELKADLDAWLEGRPVQARSASSLYVIRKLAAKHSFETLVIFTLIAILIGFGSISFHLFRQEQDRAVKLSDVVQARQRLEKDWQTLAMTAQDRLREMNLELFLGEWKDGRAERARIVAEETSPGTAERAAMEFLLDDGIPLEKLLAEVGQKTAVAYFAAGERAMKTGQRGEALTAFERAMSLPGGRWLRAAIQARLDELRPAVGGGMAG
jgi:hypothetical protein